MIAQIENRNTFGLRNAKSFGILIECSVAASVWDTSGMRAVKSFGILIEGYRGGVVDGSSRQDRMSRFGMTLGW